jgi:hypothetical protein
VELVELEDDRVVERRLVTTYDMFGHVAALTLAGSEVERFVALYQAVLLPITTRVWPDWSARSPIAIAELWTLERSKP